MRRSFILLSLLLGVEVTLLLSLVIHVGWAIFLGFIVFALGHDWGRVVERPPRIVNLLRARATARAFFLTPAWPLVRRLLSDLEAPHLLEAARQERYFRFKRAPSDKALLRVGRFYAAFTATRDVSFVLFVLSLLSIIARPSQLGGMVVLGGFFIGIAGAIAARVVRVRPDLL